MLVAVVPALVGLGLDFARTGSIGVVAWVLTLLGAVLSVLLVRRHSLFTAMVQPPLVVAFAVIVAYLIVVNRKILGVGLALINSFPLMVIATATALVLGLIRILAQPLRRTSARPAASAQSVR